MRCLVTAQLTAEAQHDLQHDLGWALTMDRTAISSLAHTGRSEHELDRFEAAIVEADPVVEQTLRALPALRVLACVRGDPVNVDIAAATARGIPVLYAPGRNAEAVADFTLGLMLASLRHIATAHRLLVTGQLTEERDQQAPQVDVIWTYRDRSRPHPYALYKGPELAAQTVGLIGFGDIGRAVARRLVGLGVHTLVADPYVAPEQIAAAHCEPVALDRLLYESTIISLHARGSGAPLLGERELRSIRPGSYLINTARATLLDYEALYKVLAEGHLAGAALDVFPREPLPPDSPLLTLDNVTLTPHLAGASTDVVVHQSQIIIANITALLHGDREHVAVKNPTALEAWYAREAEQR